MNKHILDDFIHIANSYPSHSAIENDFGVLSYADLLKNVQKQASEISRLVRRARNGRPQVIAVVSDRSGASIAAMLGIWFHGSVSLMLDPNLGLARIQKELENAQVDFVLYDTQLPQIEQHLTDWGIDKFSAGLTTANISDAPILVTHKNVPEKGDLYIAYSSGTTSKPKALLNTSHALQLAVDAHKRQLKLGQDRVVLQRSTTQFDGFYLEVMIALSSGACMVLYGNSSHKALDYQHICEHHNVTDVILPPSVASLLDPSQLPQLLHVVLAGEAPSMREVDRWLSAGKVVFNGYGLVQDGVCTTLNPCSPSDYWDQKIAIGKKAIAGKELLIIDPKTGQPAIKGHLCIAGGGLAKGYLIDGKVSDSYNAVSATDTTCDWNSSGYCFDPTTKQRVFKTGDEATIHNDMLFVTGRLDRQIQLNGQTINPELIETMLINRLIEQGFLKSRVFVNTYMILGKKRLQACIVAPMSECQPNMTQLVSSLHSALPSRIFFHMTDRWEDFGTHNEKLNINTFKTLLQDTSSLTLLIDECELPNELTLYEKELVKYTHEILGWPIDSFVDTQKDLHLLGYQSIDITLLMQHLQKEYAVELVYNLLPIHITIKSLATHLANSIAYYHAIKPLPGADQDDDPQAVLLLIHPVTGTVNDYQNSELASTRLPANTQVMTLCSPGLIEDMVLRKQVAEHQFPASVADQVRYIVQAIQTRLGSIPLYVAGWSYGGLLALEVSERLRQLNYDVVSTTVLDTASFSDIQANENPLAIFRHLLNYLFRSHYPNTVNIPADLLALYDSLASNPTHWESDITMLTNGYVQCAHSLEQTAQSRYQFKCQVLASKMNFTAGTRFTKEGPYQLDTVLMIASDQNAEMKMDDNPYRAIEANWDSYFDEGVLSFVEIKKTTHLTVLAAPELTPIMVNHLKQHKSQRLQSTIVFDSEHKIVGDFPLPCEFVGRRKESVQLTERLEDTKTTYISLFGVGGVGKTQLLMRCLKRRKEQMVGKVFVINAENSIAIEKSYLTIAQHLTLDVSDGNWAQMVNQVLSKTLKGWVLVFDNIHDDFDFLVRYRIFDIDCQDAQGKIVFVSRKVEKMHSRVQCFVNVDVLHIDDAVEYVEQQLGVQHGQDKDAIASFVSKALSCHPLALSQSCAYIKMKMLEDPSYDFDAFINEYQARRDQMTDVKALPSAEYETSLQVCWMLTRKSLQAQFGRQSVQDQLFGFLSFLNPERCDVQFLGIIAQALRSGDLTFSIDQYVVRVSKYLVAQPHIEQHVVQGFAIHRLIQDLIFDELSFEQKYQCFEHLYRLFTSQTSCAFDVYSQGFGQRYIANAEIGDIRGLQDFAPVSSSIMQDHLFSSDILPSVNQLSSRSVLASDLEFLNCIDRMVDRYIETFMHHLADESINFEHVLRILLSSIDLFERLRGGYMALDLNDRLMDKFYNIFLFVSKIFDSKVVCSRLIDQVSDMNSVDFSTIATMLSKFFISAANIINNPYFLAMAGMMQAGEEFSRSMVISGLGESRTTLRNHLLESVYSFRQKNVETLKLYQQWVAEEPESGSVWYKLFKLNCELTRYDDILDMLCNKHIPTKVQNKSWQTTALFLALARLERWGAMLCLINDYTAPTVYLAQGVYYFPLLLPQLQRVLGNNELQSDMPKALFFDFYRIIAHHEMGNVEQRDGAVDAYHRHHIVDNKIIGERVLAECFYRVLLDVCEVQESVLDLFSAQNSMPNSVLPLSPQVRRTSPSSGMGIEGALPLMLGMFALMRQPNSPEYKELFSQEPRQPQDPLLALKEAILLSLHQCVINNEVHVYFPSTQEAQHVYENFLLTDYNFGESGVHVINLSPRFSMSQAQAALIIPKPLYGLLFSEQDAALLEQQDQLDDQFNM